MRQHYATSVLCEADLYCIVDVNETLTDGDKTGQHLHMCVFSHSVPLLPMHTENMPWWSDEGLYESSGSVSHAGVVVSNQ